MSLGGDKSNGELKSNGLKAGLPALQPGPSAVKPRPPAAQSGTSAAQPGPPAAQPGPPTAQSGPPAAQPGPPAAPPGPPEAQLEREGSGAEKGIARLKRLFDAHIFPGTFFTSFRAR
jgi:hypothetical protein